MPVYPVDAQTAGTELENILERRGALRPADVVEESKSADAPLHRCFEWDDERAAVKYRKRQAQDLIHNIVTVKIGKIEPPTPVRAFVSFRQTHEYVPVAQVLQNPVMREYMLDAALKELEAFKHKYASLDSLSELMASIDRSIECYKQHLG